MSLTFKLGSLAIRTLAKPLSNYIKRNAAEHERFRRIAVSFAQRLHRIDMRLRLGLLQDPAVIERQIQRELKEVEKKRQRDAAPTVKTEAETKAEEELLKKEKEGVVEHVKAVNKPPRIRPLSESKAIETGANFISETFLFMVAGGLILLETWRRDRKDKKQDADVAEKLAAAERERVEMREQLELMHQELEAFRLHKLFSPPTATTAPTTSTLSSEPKAKPEGETSNAAPVQISSTPAQIKSRQEAKSGSSSLSSWLPSNWFGSGTKPNSA